MESNRYSDSDSDSDDYYDYDDISKRTLSRLNDTTLCDSDDGKTFMNKSYSDILPSHDIKEKKKQMKTIFDPSGFESQYKDLLDVNQYLCTKLVNNPDNQITCFTALKYFNDITKEIYYESKKDKCHQLL